MKSKSLPVVLFFALLTCDIVSGQGTLGEKPKKARTADDYKSRTLKELAAMATTKSLGNKEETMVVHSDELPSRVRATYTGTTRPLPKIKQEILRQWARLYAGVPESYTSYYETELLFTEGGIKYWLAVRKNVLPRFAQELQEGEAVDLFLIRMGAAKIPSEWEPLLLVENFQMAK